MNYIVTKKQLRVLTENITSSKFSTKDVNEVKNTQPNQQKNFNNSLKDYEGTYTFTEKGKEPIKGNVKEHDGKLLVSRGTNSFYLTKTETDQFEGTVVASNEEDDRIPKIVGHITIKMTAKFNRNNNNQVCSVSGVATWGFKKENMVATKDGVSCTDSPTVPDSTTVKPTVPDSTTVKPTVPDSTTVQPTVQSQAPVNNQTVPNSTIPQIKKTTIPQVKKIISRV